LVTYSEDKEERAMARILPISVVKARLPELVTGVQDREEEIVVTRKGRPAAVLVNHAEYERLKETVDVLSDPMLMRQIRASGRFYAAGRRGLSFEDVFGEPIIQAKRRRR
jgi:prevent-host-death family protein